MLTLSINATCILLYLSKAIYIYIYVECINLSVYKNYFLGELFQSLFLCPETKKLVIPILCLYLFSSLSIHALCIPTSEIPQTSLDIHP
jgi:hypothetical protein